MLEVIIAFHSKKCYNSKRFAKKETDIRCGARRKGNEMDLEKLLMEGRIIRIQTTGYSMYPMLVPGRDEVILKNADPSQLKRGDVVLYRRENSILVLHRIWKKEKDTFYMVGDNQMELEGPLRADQMRGVLVGFVRRGKEISVSNPVYVLYSRIWLLLRPFRPVLAKTVHVFRVKKRE